MSATTFRAIGPQGKVVVHLMTDGDAALEAGWKSVIKTLLEHVGPVQKSDEWELVPREPSEARK